MTQAVTEEDLLDDPTDWQSPEWQSVDAALRCGICKELLSAAMMLPACSHNFCSLCVRQAFDAQQAIEKYCPTCRKPANVSTMTANRALDDISRHFGLVRNDTILALQRGADQAGVNVVKCDQATSPIRPQSSGATVADDAESSDCDDYNGNFVPTPEEPRVSTRRAKRLQTDCRPKGIECPICNDMIDVEPNEMDAHVDECLTLASLNETRPSKRQRSVPSQQQQQVIPPPSAKHHRTLPVVERKPLAKVYFKGLADAKLRTMLRDASLAWHGDRQTLERRYKQWMLFWNAACDNKHEAITDTQLRQQLSDWERAQDKEQKPAAIDVQKHAKAHKSAFDALIEQGRQRLNNASNTTE